MGAEDVEDLGALDDQDLRELGLTDAQKARFVNALEDAADATGAPSATALTQEDTDALFDGALDAAAELVFYLSPLVEEWEAPEHPMLRADRAAPPVPMLCVETSPAHI